MYIRNIFISLTIRLTILLSPCTQKTIYNVWKILKTISRVHKNYIPCSQNPIIVSENTKIYNLCLKNIKNYISCSQNPIIVSENTKIYNLCLKNTKNYISCSQNPIIVSENTKITLWTYLVSYKTLKCYR